MTQTTPRFPRSTPAEEVSWMNARMSQYPVDLFSTYGIRCNTLDDLTDWRRCAREGMPEAACQLGLAYLDGNGAAVDVAEARRWLNVGAAKQHLFCRYKLAELDVEVMTKTGGQLTAGSVQALDVILVCAQAGVGEAYVTLAFVLKAHAERLRVLGWDTAQAKALTDCFLRTLRVAYAYRKGDSPTELLEGLRQLSEAGSGHACFCEGRFLEDLGRKEEALRRYVVGARQHRNLRCLTKALDLARDEELEELLLWSASNLPTGETYEHLCFATIQHFSSDPEKAAKALTRHAGSALTVFLKEERFDDAYCFAVFLSDLGFLNQSPEARETGERLFQELRRLAPRIDLPELSMHFLGKCLHRLQKAIDDKCIAMGVPPLTRSTEAFGSRMGVPPLKNMEITPEQLTELEFISIREHGLLLRGVARGKADACEISAKWSWNQHFWTQRICVPGIGIPHPVDCTAYDYALAYEFLCGKPSALRPHLEEDLPASFRDGRDEVVKPEADRLRAANAREQVYRTFGRACRPSLSLIRDILDGRNHAPGDHLPWQAKASATGPADPVAALWSKPLLSRCPIDSNWRLYAGANDESRDSQDAPEMIRLVKAGDYRGAELFYCQGMSMILSNLFGRFHFQIHRLLDDHELLSLMVREMMMRGDYVSAETLVDYLIYARMKLQPWGQLHHLSAWIKYHLGKLSDALIMMEDCVEAIVSEAPSEENLTVDLTEFRIMYVELLLRAQRLDDADAFLAILIAANPGIGDSDPRVAFLMRTVAEIRSGTRQQYVDAKNADGTDLSRSYFDRDLKITAQVMVGPHLSMAELINLSSGRSEKVPDYLRLSLSNMDRYRGFVGSLA